MAIKYEEAEESPALSEGGGSGGGPGDAEPGDHWDGGGDDGERGPPPGSYHVGIWASMVAIAAFFFALGLAYVLRSRLPKHWTPVELPHMFWVSTAILLVSSGTAEAARQMLRRGREVAYCSWIAATLLLGVAFLAAQFLSWRQLAAQGVFLAGNPHSSFLYLFTAAHAAHLAGGMLALLYLLLRAVATLVKAGKHPKRGEASDVVVTYWHFMDAIWIALFSLLLLVG